MNRRLKYAKAGMECFELCRYFGTVAAHSPVNLADHNAAYCYTFTGQARFHVARTVEVEVPGSRESVPEHFLDDPGVPLCMQTLDDPGGEWVAINLKFMDKTGEIALAGVYHPGRHLLVATDWVHSADSDELIRRIAEAMHWEAWHTPLPGPPPLLGADPEFECWDDGDILESCDDDTLDDPDLGEVGLDGPVYEVRPLPTRDPAELYHRIRTLIEKWQRQTGYYACLSGHTYPIGCHIHLGGPDDWIVRGDLNSFVQEVDRRVGFVVRLSGEARASYRKRAAWRMKPHGLEYRTPPSAILAFPETFIWVAGSLLAIANGDQPPLLLRRPVIDQFRAIQDMIDSRVPFGLDLKPLT